MQIHPLSPDFAVADQLESTDVAAVAAQGFRSLICNRPDGEAPGQPPHAELREAAEAAGLAFRYIPSISGAPRMEDVTRTEAALREMPAPVLAYCRSGARSQGLWLMAREHLS